MKVMTILGRRSDIIKLSLIIKVLDQHCEHTLVFTGEDAEDALVDLHFKDLDIRRPDHDLRVNGQSPGLEISLSQLLASVHPDRVLIVADSVSAKTAAAVAKKFRVISYNFGAANSSIDADVVMLCSDAAREKPATQGMQAIVVGDPGAEILDTFVDSIESSSILKDLSLRPFEYFLATVHHSENILTASVLEAVLDALGNVAQKFDRTLVFPVHPRTARQLESFQLKAPAGVRLLKSLSFFDLAKLEKNALAVLTDSTGIQAECCILGVPCVTLSKDSVRVETLSCGSNILAGTRIDDVLRAVELAIGQPAAWTPPVAYARLNVSQIVSRIVLGAA